MSSLKTIFRILTFRAKREELAQNALAVLAIAIVITWLVGIGRWWDDPRELPLFVRLGAGSVIYVFAMSLLLWILANPISKEKLPYWSFAAFVASTSLPGLVYAVPMEQWTDLSTASTYNVWALTFVSVYRVSLLFWFYLRVLKLNAGEALVVTGLPISAISIVLVSLGHGARVLDIMGGLRDRMSKTDMETIVGLIGCLSWVIGPVLFIIYFGVAARVALERRSEKPPGETQL